MTSAAPPSEIWEAFPAVIVPSLWNAGFSAPSDSVVVPGRTPSSVSTRIGSPLRWGISTGAISSARRPSLIAADAARSWLFAARSSCSVARDLLLVRVALRSRAHVLHVERAPQAVVDQRVHASRRCPCGTRPARPASTYGACVIDSMPPATTTSASPDWII